MLAYMYRVDREPISLLTPGASQACVVLTNSVVKTCKELPIASKIKKRKESIHVMDVPGSTCGPLQGEKRTHAQCMYDWLYFQHMYAW